MQHHKRESSMSLLRAFLYDMLADLEAGLSGNRR